MYKFSEQFLKLWKVKLKATTLFGAIALVLDTIGYILSLRTLPEELRVISDILLCGIPVIIIGILSWTAIEARKEARAEKPKIELMPSHLPIRDKEGNTIGIEQFYDMDISTLNCLKYKMLEAQLNPISYSGKKEPSQVIVSPKITLWHKEKVKPNTFLHKKDIFHFYSTTRQLMLANQHQIKLHKDTEYETSIDIKDNKNTLYTKHYLMRLTQLSEHLVGLIVEEIEVWKLGGDL